VNKSFHIYSVDQSQSDADQCRRQSLQCSWTSSLEQPFHGPQTAGLVIQPFQTIAVILSVEPKCFRNPLTDVFLYLNVWLKLLD